MSDRKRAFRVCVEAPEGVDYDGLFTAIADAAAEWEPEERDGWDLNVYASVVEVDDV